MNLIYLSDKQSVNESFLKTLATHLLRIPHQQFILVHETTAPKISVTRFQTKRISACFNEVGYHNLAFSGDQRGILQQNNHEFALQKEILSKFLTTVNCLVINSLCKSSTGSYLENVQDLASKIQSELKIAHTIIFPENSRSLLGNQYEANVAGEKLPRLLRIYPEEAETIQRATLLKAIIAQPQSLLSLFE